MPISNAPHAWSVALTNSSYTVKETSFVFSGDSAVQYVYGAGGTAGAFQGITTNDPTKGAFCVVFRPGLTYRIKIASAVSSIANAPTYRLTLTFNVGGTLTASQTFTYAAANAYQVDEWVFTVPANAEPNARLAIEFNRNATTATNFWVDSLRFEEDLPSVSALATAAAIAGTNIVQNGGFESGVSFWRLENGTSFDSTTTTPLVGTKSGVVVAVASTLMRLQQCDRASDLSGGQNPTGGNPLYVPVNGGDEIYGSLKVSAGTNDASASIKFGVEEYDANKALVQRTYLATSGGISSTTTLVGGATLQASTAYIVVIFEQTASAGGGAITYKWDAIQCYRVSPPKLRVKAFLNAAQSVGTGADATLSWNGSDEFDVGAMHDSTGVLHAASRVIVPAAAVGYGAFHLHAQVQFASNATGYRRIKLKKNGATIIAEAEATAINGDVTTFDLSVIEHHPASGDFYEVIVFQNSGGALNVNSGAPASFFEAHQIV